MRKLKQTSRPSTGLTRLQFKIGDLEFKAEGTPTTVTQQFEQFQELVRSWKHLSQDIPSTKLRLHQGPPISSSSRPEVSLPVLEHILEVDPNSSLLLCRIPPAGKEPEAKLVLLILLGYRELRAVEEVPVLWLKKALERSFRPVLRLDRVLRQYARERFVIKIGRGKGGKYRLTPLGINKATVIAAELNTEWSRG